MHPQPDESASINCLIATVAKKKENMFIDEDGREWQRMNVVIDSGAATSGIGKDALPDWPLHENKGPKTYTAGSDGAKVHVLGFKCPVIWTQDGGAYKAVPLKVLTPLLKPSFAVSDLLENHEVMFNLEKTWRFISERTVNGHQDQSISTKWSIHDTRMVQERTNPRRIKGTTCKRG